MNKKQVSIDVFQIGARMHYAVPEIFDQHAMLGKLYTDITKNNVIAKILDKLPLISSKSGGVKRLNSRDTKTINKNKIVEFPTVGVTLAFGGALAKTPKASQRIKKWGVNAFEKKVLRKWDRKCDLVYVFNHQALEILKTACDNNIRSIYEQPIAPRRGLVDILKREHDRWIGWEVIAKGFDDYFINKEIAEWELSNIIIAPSEFVKKGLVREGVSAEKIKLVPYGFGTNDIDIITYPNCKREASIKLNKKIKILFVGTLSLRKGIQYLYSAAEKLNKSNLEIHAIGRNLLEVEALKKISSVIKLHGTMTKNQVLDEMDQADLFVFPTLCEGSATVIYEALSRGLPVITTESAGSVVRDGKEGLIVNAGDVEQLKNAIQELVDDKTMRNNMSIAALARAKEYTLQKYSERLVNIIS